MNIGDLLLRGVWKYLQAHPERIEKLVESAIESLVLLAIQKLVEHHAANPVAAPAAVLVPVNE